MGKVPYGKRQTKGVEVLYRFSTCVWVPGALGRTYRPGMRPGVVYVTTEQTILLCSTVSIRLYKHIYRIENIQYIVYSLVSIYSSYILCWYGTPQTTGQSGERSINLYSIYLILFSGIYLHTAILIARPPHTHAPSCAESAGAPFALRLRTARILGLVLGVDANRDAVLVSTSCRQEEAPKG